jgi:hypothetical protein
MAPSWATLASRVELYGKATDIAIRGTHQSTVAALFPAALINRNEKERAKVHRNTIRATLVPGAGEQALPRRDIITTSP